MTKRLVSITISLGLIAILWWWVDARAIWHAAARVDRAWLWAAIAMTVPLTAATAQRFRWLADNAVTVGTASRLILSASTLNLILPSKLGDIAKSWVLRRQEGMGDGRALALVVLEKMLDMMSLLAMGTVALIVMPAAPAGATIVMLVTGGGAAALFILTLPGLPIPANRLPLKLATMVGAWRGLTFWFWARRTRAVGLILVSLLIWAGHLVQIWLFARAIAPGVPFAGAAIAATLAILAGLLPLTFAGVGTRDAAMVVLFAPWLDQGEAALLGLFATLRYILPAIAGLPFVREYWRAPATGDA